MTRAPAQADTRKKAVDKVMKMRTEVAIPSESSEALLEYGFAVTADYYTNAFRASKAKMRLLLASLSSPSAPISRVHWCPPPPSQEHGADGGQQLLRPLLEHAVHHSSNAVAPIL